MPRSILLGRPWPSAGEPLFTEEDTDWAIALHEQEAAEAAERCPLCGLPKTACRDPEHQGAYIAEAERCHATYAILAAQGAEDPSQGSTAWTARLRTRPT